MSILLVVADRNHFPGFHPYAPRPLNVQKKKLHRIIDPQQFVTRQRRLSVLDFGARVIGDNPPAIEPATQALSSEFRVEATELDR